MNRLIIIGNGFDRAHDLPTSYGQFLDYIWQIFGDVYDNKLIEKLFDIDYDFIRLKSYTSYRNFFQDFRRSYDSNGYSFYESDNHNACFKIYYKHPFFDDNSKCVFQFKNIFFELITARNLENWVDIEDLYYQVLLSIVKEDNKFEQIKNISQLNDEFLQIKNLLNFYLNQKVENNFVFENVYPECKTICDLFEYRLIGNDRDDRKRFLLEFPLSYHEELIDWNQKQKIRLTNYNAPQNLFVDFNYTSNISNYVNVLNGLPSYRYGVSEQIQIHGSINSTDNPINFGFGDEMDDHYKVLEKIGDNRYLENIKSFMYFNNSNYKKLLSWIGSNDYQVFVMGHSCGLSDRTLLNTLFEHENCKSIKIFYYAKEDGTDNFTELTQNISRHFNKKAMMREKVVDKSLSTSLPQDIRYKNKT